MDLLAKEACVWLTVRFQGVADPDCGPSTSGSPRKPGDYSRAEAFLTCFAKKPIIGARAGWATLMWEPPGTSTYVISAPTFLPASTMARDMLTLTVRSLSPWVTYCGMSLIFAMPFVSPPPEMGPSAANISGCAMAMLQVP